LFNGGGEDAADTGEHEHGGFMASDFVTRWLEERKPGARVSYLGAGDDDVHIWDVAFTGEEHTFRLGVVASIVDDEALLAERLMELDTQGWVDQAGEKDIWVLVAPGELANEPGLFTSRDELPEPRPRSRGKHW
jgi:hypothetical protein